jgi:hypothetical protein
MNNHSQAYIEFEKNVSNLRRLFYGMHYLDVKKDEYIKWLKDVKSESFPEKAFNQELWSTIEIELEVSNILLRTYIERFGYEKCGDFDVFLKRYGNQIESYKIKYQRDLTPLPVLDINRELRNQSIHSEPTYKLIQSPKKPIRILSEPVMRMTNNLGEKEIALLHDLKRESWEKELDKANKKMSPSSYKNNSSMTYGELLRDEVLECIRQIDLI